MVRRSKGEVLHGQAIIQTYSHLIASCQDMTFANLACELTEEVRFDLGSLLSIQRLIFVHKHVFDDETFRLYPTRSSQIELSRALVANRAAFMFWGSSSSRYPIQNNPLLQVETCWIIMKLRFTSSRLLNQQWSFSLRTSNASSPGTKTAFWTTQSENLCALQELDAQTRLGFVCISLSSKSTRIFLFFPQTRCTTQCQSFKALSALVKNSRVPLLWSSEGS